MDYSEEITKKAEDHPSLGAEYFAAREAAERFLKHWQDEHAEQLAEAIMKPVLDAVHDKVWDSFRDFLLGDTEYNAQLVMTRMVEASRKQIPQGHGATHCLLHSPPRPHPRKRRPGWLT